MGESDGLTEIADRLYALPVDRFTAARDELVKGCGDKLLAAGVKKLRKPSTAAWAVNVLVRREAQQIDSVLELAESLRAAAEALDGDELRALTRQRRQLTSVLASSARSLAREEGVRLSGPVVEQVEGMLTAAMLDPVAAEVVRTGRVLSAFTSTGVSVIDVASVVALPDALEVRAVPVEGPIGTNEEQAAPVELHVVPDDTARLEAAEKALAEAADQLREAEDELSEVETSMEALNARRLQLQGEADELRRRLAEIENDVDQVDDDLEEADEARADAAGVVAEARRARGVAQEKVDRLRG